MGQQREAGRAPAAHSGAMREFFREAFASGTQVTRGPRWRTRSHETQHDPWED